MIKTKTKKQLIKHLENIYSIVCEIEKTGNQEIDDRLSDVAFSCRTALGKQKKINRPNNLTSFFKKNFKKIRSN